VNLERFSSVRRFLERWDGSGRSLRVYLGDLHHFCNVTGMTPDDLVRLSNPVPVIMDYLRSMLEEGRSFKTVRHNYVGLKAFLRANGHDVDRFPLLRKPRSEKAQLSWTDELLKLPSVKEWLSNFSDSPSTVSTYLRNFRVWVAWLREHGYTPKSYLEQFKAADEEKRKELYAVINRLHSKLLEDGKSPKYALNVHVTVRSWLSWNGCEKLLPKIKRRFKRVYATSEEYWTPTPEETHRMIDAAPSMRDKAVISFLAGTGQRVEILTALKVKHVKEIFEDKFPPIIHISAVLPNYKGENVNKGRVPYKFPIPLETAEYIKLMLKKREADGELISDDSWLFRSYAVAGEGIPVKIRKSDPGLPISTRGIQSIVKRAAERAGIQRTIGEYGKPYSLYIHPHEFRRSYKERLTEARVDPLLRDFFMGHVLPIKGVYDKFSDSMIRRVWMMRNVESYLSISTDKRLQGLHQLMELARSFGLEPSDLLKQIRDYESFDELAERLRRLIIASIRERTLEGGMSLTIIRPKQKIVDEAELEEYLTLGWEVVAVLRSGKVIIKSPSS